MIATVQMYIKLPDPLAYCQFTARTRQVFRTSVICCPRSLSTHANYGWRVMPMRWTPIGSTLPIVDDKMTTHDPSLSDTGIGKMEPRPANALSPSCCVVTLREAIFRWMAQIARGLRVRETATFTRMIRISSCDRSPNFAGDAVSKKSSSALISLAIWSARICGTLPCAGAKRLGSEGRKKRHRGR
jgi:hypothetical protein